MPPSQCRAFSKLWCIKYKHCFKLKSNRSPLSRNTKIKFSSQKVFFFQSNCSFFFFFLILRDRRETKLWPQAQFSDFLTLRSHCSQGGWQVGRGQDCQSGYLHVTHHPPRNGPIPLPASLGRMESELRSLRPEVPQLCCDLNVPLPHAKDNLQIKGSSAVMTPQFPSFSLE